MGAPFCTMHGWTAPISKPSPNGLAMKSPSHMEVVRLAKFAKTQGSFVGRASDMVAPMQSVIVPLLAATTNSQPFMLTSAGPPGCHMALGRT